MTPQGSCLRTQLDQFFFTTKEYNIVVITVNGKERECNSTIHLHALLLELDLEKSICAIEVNNTLVPHVERNAFIIHNGDTVEIVTLVGGG